MPFQQRMLSGALTSNNDKITSHSGSVGHQVILRRLLGPSLLGAESKQTI